MTPDEQQQKRLLAFAQAYDPALTEAPEAFQFGDSPEMADRLLALVLSGKKTATTGWPADPSVYEGMLSIVLDGRNQPRAIIRTVQVEQVPFLEVSAAFAAAEGEGDLTLDWWREAHRHFFLRQQTEHPFPDKEAVQCETFEVVWPQP